MKALLVMPSGWWVRPAHLMLGSLVVAVGALPAADALSLSRVALLAVVTGGFLSWQRSTIGLTWAWTTPLLWLESLAWPLVTIYQIRHLTAEPHDDQMSTILTAVSFRLFSAVFWISFSYGLFKRTGRDHSDLPVTVLAPQPVARPECQRKK